MIGIIDYGAGNVRSVANALEKLGFDSLISGDRKKLQAADRLILPGVGEARSAMASLGKSELLAWLRDVDVPFLGICLGMQLLFDHSTERKTDCLGVIGGIIERFDNSKLKVPHMGWNTVSIREESPLFYGIGAGEYFYFVHSYYAPVSKETLGVSDYSIRFSSAVRSGNYYGVQFHPEKSGRAGLQLLKNFGERCS
ncbi:MAG: imidazole glycerol phosphate synthase subunit HisH [Bacteroidota bacterium]